MNRYYNVFIINRFLIYNQRFLFLCILYWTNENVIKSFSMQDIDNFVKCRIVNGTGRCTSVVIYHSTENVAITILLYLHINLQDIHKENVLVRLSVIFKNMHMIFYHILVTGMFCIMNEKVVQSR